jgi:uncharacterized membrane protein YwzB
MNSLFDFFRKPSVPSRTEVVVVVGAVVGAVVAVPFLSLLSLSLLLSLLID